MKQVYKSCLVLLIAITTYGILMTGCQHKEEGMKEEEEENEMYDGPDKAAEFQFNRTKNPFTGQVPSDKMWDAVLQTQQVKNQQANSQNLISALSWIERGSNSDVTGPSNGNTRANSGMTSGRIDASRLSKA